MNIYETCPGCKGKGYEYHRCPLCEDHGITLTSHGKQVLTLFMREIKDDILTGMKERINELERQVSDLEDELKALRK